MNRLIHRSWGEGDGEEFSCKIRGKNLKSHARSPCCLPYMNAMMAQVMSMSGGRGGFPGMQMQQAPKEEGVTYLCVADVQITDRKIGKPLGQPTAGQATTGPRIQQMRMVGHVRQKDLDIPEATPIIQEKISTGIAGLF